MENVKKPPILIEMFTLKNDITTGFDVLTEFGETEKLMGLELFKAQSTHVIELQYILCINFWNLFIYRLKKDKHNGIIWSENNFSQPSYNKISASRPFVFTGLKV